MLEPWDNGTISISYRTRIKANQAPGHDADVDPERLTCNAIRGTDGMTDQTGKYLGDIGGPAGFRCSKTIIIPAFNEEHRIAPTLEQYLSYFDEDTEIMVVLNECSDRTAEVAASFMRDNVNLRIIDEPGVKGKGVAIRCGFYKAKGEIISYVDADGAVEAQEIDRLIGMLEGRDGIIGSRWIDRSSVRGRQNAYREFVSRIFNLIVRLIFWMPYTDTQCGAKVFRRRAVDAVVDELTTTNFAFDVDVLYLMRKKGFLLVEVPAVWEDKPGSKIRTWRAGPLMLLALIRMRIKHSRLENLVR